MVRSWRRLGCYCCYYCSVFVTGWSGGGRGAMLALAPWRMVSTWRERNANHPTTQVARPFDTKTFPLGTNQSEIDTYFMQLALDQARLASETYQEVPIGAIVVRQTDDSSHHFDTSLGSTSRPCDRTLSYEILSACGNRVESWHDASAHAELLALQAAGRAVSNWRLGMENRTTLYATLEPCPMCWSAVHAFRVPRLVYGAPDHRLGAVVTHASTLGFDSSSHPFHAHVSVTSGVQAETSRLLLREFFQKRRRETKRAATSLQEDSSQSNESRENPLVRWWRRLRSRRRT